MKKLLTMCLLLLSAAVLLVAQDDCGCGEDEDISSEIWVIPEKITTTSVLVEKGKPADFYAAENLIDDSWKSWVEGKSGDGINSEITYSWTNPKDICSIMIRNGYGELRFYYKNNRVKDILITDGTTSYTSTLRDTSLPQFIDVSFPGCTALTFRILSVYKGTAYDDTCLAELRVIQSDSYTYMNLADSFTYDDYTRAAIEKIDLGVEYGTTISRSIYGQVMNLSNSNHKSDYVLHYLENGKLILLCGHQEKIITGSRPKTWYWKSDGIRYLEWNGNEWVESSDAAFDAIRANTPTCLYGSPLDDYPHAMDFWCTSTEGTFCYQLTSDGFEQVFDWVYASER